jgi:peptidyl-dipeptidase Dcp
MKKIPILFSIAMASIITSCNNPSSDKSDSSRSNPLMTESKLPYQAPEFDKIKDSDYQPAIEEGMKQQLAEMNAIANTAAAPTFENTLVAMEKSGQLLHRAYAVFNAVGGANTNPVLQKLQEDIAPKLAAHQDAIYLNAKLFARVEAIYNQRATLKLDPESARLIEYYYQAFLLAGAKLTEENKTSLKKLNEEEAGLGAKFSNQLLAAAKSGAFVTDSKEALAGLSDEEIQAAAKDAKEAGKAGKWLLPLQNTTQQPSLQSLSNRTTRKQLFEASWNRAEHNDANDTRKIISRIAKIRADKAKLLGFPNYAAWKLQDQMAKTPTAVFNFFNQLIPAATAKARKEAGDIQDLIHQQKDTFAVAAWDWDYYSEQVRKARYDLDESQIKPYFVIDSVLKNGVFFAATQLYGITFKERKDIPVYQKDVRVFEVFNEDGSAIGLFYCDYFKRDNKNGGAWMDNMVGQSKLLGTKPVIFNVCNFTKPADGQAALISFDDVTTMFHEFGHALHGFFADQQYPSLSGTATARDFVEFPSQFNEHWTLYPTVLKNYARHYKTNETIPDALVTKIKNAGTFNQGYAITEVITAAALDMQWHTLGADAPEQNVDTYEVAALKKMHLDLSYVPSRYRSSYFAHIWGGGYSAGYYAYLWTEMLDHDAYAWFEENGGLTRANGQRFRNMVLSRGNTEELGKMFFDFRGHAPDIKPMLKNRGLN